MRTVKARDVKIGDVIKFTWDNDPGDCEHGPEPDIQEAVFPVAEIGERGLQVNEEIRDKLQFSTKDGVHGLPEDHRVFRLAWPDEDILVYEPEDLEDPLIVSISPDQADAINDALHELFFGRGTDVDWRFSPTKDALMLDMEDFNELFSTAIMLRDKFGLIVNLEE